jgi:hypothetical protein
MGRFVRSPDLHRGNKYGVAYAAITSLLAAKTAQNVQD